MLPFPLLSCYIPCLQQLPTSLSVIIPVYEPPFFLLAVAYMFPRGLFSQHTLWMHSEMHVSVPAWCSGTLHLPQPLHPGTVGPCLFCSFRTWDDAFLHPSPTASLRLASLARARLLFARLLFPLKPVRSRGGVSALLVSVTKRQAPFVHGEAGRYN